MGIRESVEAHLYLKIVIVIIKTCTSLSPVMHSPSSQIVRHVIANFLWFLKRIKWIMLTANKYLY